MANKRDDDNEVRQDARAAQRQEQARAAQQREDDARKQQEAAKRASVGALGGSGGTKGTGSADDPVRVAVVPAPAPEGGFVAGEALTPAQRAGLEPMQGEEAAKDVEQSKDREHLTNMQTDFEADNALDPVSGGPSPGVTADTPLTARQVGAPVSDMSGRPALSTSDQELLPRIRDGLRQAKSDDANNDAIPDDRKGWRTPQDLGIPGGVMRRIMEAGAPMESETVPNGHFFPETGTRYRMK